MIEGAAGKLAYPGFAPAAARPSTYRSELCSGSPRLPGGPVPPTMAAMTMVGYPFATRGPKGTSLHGSRVDIILIIQDNERKGVRENGSATTR